MFAFYRRRVGNFSKQLNKLFELEDKIVKEAEEHIAASTEVIKILSEEVRVTQEVIRVAKRMR